MQSSTHSEDLIEISGIKNFPLNSQDNWDVLWNERPVWTEQEIPNELNTTFGAPSIVSNDKFISILTVWVVGDSFTGGLKQYFNATFKHMRYIGHWHEKLKSLPDELDRAEKSPDLIVRVERSL